MTKQEFAEYYEKNKIVVIGVPIIIFIVLLNTFVLKPARLAKKRALYGNKKNTASINKKNVKNNISAKTSKGKLVPPPPIRQIYIPKLSKKIETRFASNRIYPYLKKSRNIFIPAINQNQIVNIIPDEDKDEDKSKYVERPDITYHGFFCLGKDKVAILKMAGELMYSKLGAILKHTNFKLQSVSPEKIVVTDISSDDAREFEISLADTKVDKPSRGTR